MSDKADDQGTVEFEFPDNWMPWTGQTLIDYQLALGAFLVAFNRIENAVSDLIGTILIKSGRQDLVKTAVKRQLGPRVEILQWLLVQDPAAPTVPVARIKTLSDHRAELAHGHFEENPFTGEYQIVGKGERHDWTPQTIEPLGTEARAIFAELQRIRVHLWFEDLETE